MDQVTMEKVQLVVKTHSKTKIFTTSILAILCALLIVTAGSGIGAIYLAYQSNILKAANTSSNKINTPKASITPTLSLKKQGSEIISLDTSYNKYLNYDLGISITFSKDVASTASCSGAAPQIHANEISVPIQIFPDTANNSIYIAGNQYAKTRDHQISPGVYQGIDSCVVSNTTLSIIKNAADSLDHHDWVESMVFTYGKVTSTAGLDTFVKPLVPDGMIIDHMAQPAQSGNVYTYPFKYVGNQIASPPEAHWYYLLYDPTRQLALFWVTPDGQCDCWTEVDSSGNYTSIEPPYGNIIDQ